MTEEKSTKENENTLTTLTAEIRVTGLKVQPFAYKDGKGEMVGGESLEVRAAGFWEDKDKDKDKNGVKTWIDYYPVSLHFVVYPGHGVVPAIGDCISITISRFSRLGN